MTSNYPEENKIPFVRELCKHKSEEEIQEAEENFRAYLLLVKRIAKRMREDKDENIGSDDILEL